MTQRDIIGLVVSYLYAGSLLALAELIRRYLGLGREFTRKLVHIGAGMWIFGVLALFDNWYIGVIPFATFIVLNWIAYRYRLFAAIDSDDSSPGTVYFAISVTLLFVLFWRPESTADKAHLAAAGVMAMTWGDALAAIIGRRWGRHRYQVGTGSRSFEGSVTMFIASACAMALTLLLLPGSALSPSAVALSAGAALLAALIAAAIATLAEGISPAGTDNLSVPLLAAAALALVVPLLI
jgi:dolichol kinase